jgi:2-polyprenyl-3-methyl-5-hydroxy-6-metoxy-1,4-benzoquinol methylase
VSSVHLGNRLWWNEVVHRWPTHFRDAQVLEVGSYNVNGSIRDLVSGAALYHGIDWRPGPDVDEVCLAHAFAPRPADRRFDTLVSASMLEHDPHWMASVAQTMQALRPGGRAFWSWCSGASHPHCEETAPDGRYHPLKLEGMLELVEGLGYCVESVVSESAQYGLAENHVSNIVVEAAPPAAPWPRDAIAPDDRLTDAERQQIEGFLTARQATFLARTRDKWRELPGTRYDRVFSADLLAWSDDDLRAFWLRGRRETVVPAVRGWFQDLYRDRLQGLAVADVGPGLGFDGIFFAKHGAHVVFVDIVRDNLRLLERLAGLNGVAAEYVLADDVCNIQLPHAVDALLCVGSMHNAPFELSRRELASLTRWLRPGGLALMLAYPRERYEALGCTSFEEFGRKCDGDRTPWCEWYDDEKIRRLFGPAFRLEWSRSFGEGGIEFNWFELTKTGDR